ncbi:hypothetical protein [Hymenobacter psoromatis]|uniref:hypothetical protein n=1 Tax=Hymenobacter psoromatis TaxID=1484116 RepID=UPI001CBCCC6C|nr:hypothetical protein [Hymenobacter psoromatis]
MAAEDSSTSSDSVSDEELREMWRVRWKSSIEELTSIEYQRKTWMDAAKPSVHYTYVEFMCCYFDDLIFGSDYKLLIQDKWVSKQEVAILSEWHNALDKYSAPLNDDYNDAAILNDPDWIRIAALGAEAWNKLQLLWAESERAV